MAHQTFALGVIEICDEARAALERSGQDAHVFLCRHGRTDWGKALDGFDLAMSEHGLETAGPVRSAHHLRDGEVLVIQTNAERTRTIVYLRTG